MTKIVYRIKKNQFRDTKAMPQGICLKSEFDMNIAIDESGYECINGYRVLIVDDVTRKALCEYICHEHKWYLYKKYDL